MVRSIGKYTGLHFEEDVYPYLQSVYGGHPFLVRLTCSQVWKQSDRLSPDKTTPIRISNFVNAQAEIRDRLSAPIKDILLSLVWWYPDEYDLLRILAAGDAEFISSYLLQESSAIFQIAKYGLLRKDSPGQFAIADLRDFLNVYGEAYKKEISPFSRSDMPPSLLPEIPDLDTVGRLFSRRSEIEIRLRRAIMLYLRGLDKT